MHLSTIPEPPSTHQPAVPPGIDTLVTSLLAKEPADRPFTAKDVAALLRSARLAPRTPPDPAADVSETEEQRHLQAAEAGDTEAMFSLAKLLGDTGRIDESEPWLRGAAEAGHIGAMYLLGLLLTQTGRDNEAETWHRQAADAGNAVCMNNLGVLLHNSGRSGPAERWYRRAADTGYIDAMYNLGVLLQDTGRAAQAEAWHRKAADASDGA
ncbi:tetratricopeptide repeat protein [Streptomyces sp. NPDC001552]|uniref:tetratricopeptide repeat protein n=1 Tax=Streptomyces sp. NPDC001552 TaxID=3364587 RepID=UPI00369B569C